MRKEINKPMRSVEWNSEKCELHMIDQRLLPGAFEVVVCRDYHDTARAITDMVVRGAPAIGAAAAYGIAIAACQSNQTEIDPFTREINEAARVLNQSRPTAVNLAWAIKRMQRVLVTSNDVSALKESLIKEAVTIAEEDVLTNKKISTIGAELLKDGDTVIHHCNTGALATVDYGTALGVIRMAHEQGKRIHVLVDETRPRLQGSRLTAWELEQLKIPYEIITDNMSGYFLRKGDAQIVLFGADRVAANGDVANKIGSYMLALAANANHVPVYSVFPLSTVDMQISTGDAIPIEERDPAEVLDIQSRHQPASPAGAKARNPSFDVTPNQLLSGLITEAGILRQPFAESLNYLFKTLNQDK